MAAHERPRIEFRTPRDLVDDVLSGRVRLPPLQRGFKWTATDVTALFDSVLRGYPIGSLLFWQRPAPAQSLRVGPLTIDADAQDVAYWVVDGQQRIVSLVGALVASSDTTDPRFGVHLDVRDGTFHTAGVRQQVPPAWMPVSVLLDAGRLLSWLRAAAPHLTDQQIETADRAAEAIQDYRIPAYVLRASGEAEVLEVFLRTNMSGRALSKTEIFTALNSGLTSTGAPLDLADVARSSTEVGFGSLSDGVVMRCILAWRGRDVFRTDLRPEFDSAADRAETLQGVASALRIVVDFLRRDAGIPHARLLPYSSVLPVLVRFVRLHGAPAGRPATLLRRWVWRGAIAGLRRQGIGPGDVRVQLEAIERPDAFTASQSLLRSVPSYPDTPVELDRPSFAGAGTRISTLGLLSADPRDLTTGETVDIVALLHSGSLLAPIVDDRAQPLGGSLANRVVGSAGAGRTVRDLLVSAEPAVAAGHLVDADGQRLLADRQDAAFLERRAQAAAGAIKHHIDRMAEWGARDGRPVADAIRPVA